MVMKKVVCFGEVLWDMLPTGKKLGGAPLNVALRMQSMGIDAKVISSVGDDDQGSEIVSVMKDHQADLKHVQVSSRFETSKVLVSLDESGSASYEIKMPCAWDDIQLLESDIDAVKNADAFLYGSLVARQQCSRDTLSALLKVAKFKVFDVNLRTPHYDLATLMQLMEYADFIKFNDDEIVEICRDLGAQDLSLEACVHFIADKTQTSNICVTLGAKGGVVLKNGSLIYQKGYKIKVADTVGAGDSFLAILISQLLNGVDAPLALNYACAVGALVASKVGANPIIDKKEIQEIIQIP
jgi:fructokinase